MPKKPKRAVKATKQEIENLHSRGSRNYMWDFDDELFNGDWWKLEVANTDVKSAGNSFRTQCHVIHKRRANVHNKDGAVFVRMKVDEPIKEKKEKQ